MIRAKALAAAVAVLGLIGLLGTSPLRAEVLITEREAKLPDVIRPRAAHFPDRRFCCLAGKGPGTVKSPFDLEIRFEGRDGVKVDLNSLVVTYKKTPPVDLTERVKDFLRPAGISMPKTEVPPGDHKIYIGIRDVDGRPGGTEFSIDVAPYAIPSRS